MNRPTILVVDDERLLCVVLSKVLEDEGFDVLRAENGKVALHVMEEWTQDLILLDLNMPEMNGWTFYNEARWTGFDGPIVIVSGDGAAKAKRELGAQGSIEKPFDPDELVEVVRELLPAASSASP